MEANGYEASEVRERNNSCICHLKLSLYVTRNREIFPEHVLSKN